MEENKTIYKMNKGVNRPIEFKGLKAQYIYYLAGGLAFLLVLFCVLYISGVAVFLCLLLVLILGSVLFFGVSRLNSRYGQHGLMKRQAFKRLPRALRGHSTAVFRDLGK